MDTQTVWTRQHENVWNMLQETGRYTARREYIQLDLQEQAPLVLAAYDWLAAHGPEAGNRPEDVDYPVWVSFSRDGTMLPDAHTVILELALPPSRITHINIAKWGMILNYSYIPWMRPTRPGTRNCWRPTASAMPRLFSPGFILR